MVLKAEPLICHCALVYQYWLDSCIPSPSNTLGDEDRTLILGYNKRKLWMQHNTGKEKFYLGIQIILLNIFNRNALLVARRPFLYPIPKRSDCRNFYVPSTDLHNACVWWMMAIREITLHVLISDHSNCYCVPHWWKLHESIDCAYGMKEQEWI